MTVKSVQIPSTAQPAVRPFIPRKRRSESLPGPRLALPRRAHSSHAHFYHVGLRWKMPSKLKKRARSEPERGEESSKVKAVCDDERGREDVEEEEEEEEEENDWSSDSSELDPAMVRVYTSFPLCIG